ncbi:hypothetical protein [Deinococcus altitudinis]|uniref:hypothetical protein n=1 Tax=Deinococcus altitudinis TaxID=468914 RepID=UPI003891CC7F
MKRRIPRGPRPLFPGLFCLLTCALIFEGDGRPALYIGANTHSFRLRLHRVPTDARVLLEVPHPLPTPEEEGRYHAMQGSRVIIQTEQASTALYVNAASIARELLEALEAYGQAVKAWEAARAHFEPLPAVGAK